MSRAYSDIAFTPTVRAMQTRMGSRAAYAPLDHTDDRRDRLGEREAEFIHARDGFYQATVSETGWPYVQFRGGPAGFLKVLDEKTLGFADFRGNVQYISVGNLQGNDRISIILMDYANQRRLKILGRVHLVSEAEDPALIARLELPHYRAPVERGFIITVEAYDWNCPKHITPRYTEAEVEEAVTPLREALEKARAELQALKSKAADAAPPPATAQTLGQGPLALRISAVRQLTPRVRAYELRALDGGELPPVQAGAHLDVPVLLRSPDGRLLPSQRRYSISSNPRRRDAYEIAVLREEQGSGGSLAVHEQYQLDMTLHCALPGNDFSLRADSQAPVLLIAGGIGITPIKAMAQQLQAAGRRFVLHYAMRSAREAAYLDRLQREFGSAQLKRYAADQYERLDPAALIAAATPDTEIYVCGPARLIEAVRAAAGAAGMAGQFHAERFSAVEQAAGALQPSRITVHRRRVGQNGTEAVDVPVAAGQSLLDAVEAAGLPAQSGCRAGSCGQCAVQVLSGRPEHRDSALSPAERAAGRLCLCVSGGEDLVLALA
ncbi:2Fe-2S iron-sulfur cluster-binding protein [Paucibacter sp. APW11]|uniref:2Fe-2S iron-sulfur cluster-binding protein n=1 Tax=Roseateles aquae TaxID=3077235 RepID=A0ABU3PIS0_9BURK|nr:2Fe-2S iron-sulfur cluster-binding protein [Paucibacter sp. APW11]MDT9002453.1 2Fe-2S iron-sulfur cluster-binding protein [Paucibacter sp. APW11]